MSETYKGVDLEYAAECLRDARGFTAVTFGTISHRERAEWFDVTRYAIDQGYRPPEKPRVKTFADRITEEFLDLDGPEQASVPSAIFNALSTHGVEMMKREKPKSVREELLEVIDSARDHHGSTIQDIRDAVLAKFTVTPRGERDA